MKKTTWTEFLKTHWDVLAAADFSPSTSGPVAASWSSQDSVETLSARLASLFELVRTQPAEMTVAAGSSVKVKSIDVGRHRLLYTHRESHEILRLMRPQMDDVIAERAQGRTSKQENDRDDRRYRQQVFQRSRLYRAVGGGTSGSRSGSRKRSSVAAFVRAERLLSYRTRPHGATGGKWRKSVED